MAGHRDDGTRAENKAHHPNRRPPKPIWDDLDEYGKPSYQHSESPFVRQMFQQGHGPVSLGTVAGKPDEDMELYAHNEKYWGGVDPADSPLRKRPGRYAR